MSSVVISSKLAFAIYPFPIFTYWTHFKNILDPPSIVSVFHFLFCYCQFFFFFSLFAAFWVILMSSSSWLVLSILSPICYINTLPNMIIKVFNFVITCLNSRRYLLLSFKSVDHCIYIFFFFYNKFYVLLFGALNMVSTFSVKSLLILTYEVFIILFIPILNHKFSYHLP